MAPKRSMLERNVSLLERQLASAQQALMSAQQALMSAPVIPSEPVGLEDGTAMVYFIKVWPSGGRAYTYCANRISTGMWFVSGSRSINGASGICWEELYDFITSGISFELWVVTGLELLDNS